MTNKTQALAGVNVLITRPAAQAQNLHQLILKEGGSTFRFPTIEIVPPADVAALVRIIDRLDTFDLAIFISPNSVIYSVKAITARIGRWPARLPAAAIGETTARFLRQAGANEVLVPERADSEGLLELTRLQVVERKHIVIFRGDAGRDLLEKTLAARGAHVEFAECYRRGRPQTDASPLNAALVEGKIDIVTITSAQSLRNLCAMIDEPAKRRLAQMPIVVISDRLRGVSMELGMKGPIIVTRAASDDAMVDAIRAWHDKQKNL